jgi:gliding motility-associated-like protein
MKILRISALLTLFVALSQIAFASRILGGNITWECSGGNNYTLTLRLYTDCFGATAAVPTENLYCVPSGCGGSPLNLDLNLVSSTEISELCPAELVNSSCSGGIIPGTNLLVYSATVTLDPACNWKFFWNESDWNYANNINYTSLPNAYITSSLFPAFGCLNSIDITSLQAPYECVNSGTITNNITVSGAGGFTLSYALSTPQTSVDVNDPLGPSTTVPGFANINALAVNPTTGAVTFNSAGVPIGNYLATIEITIRQGANIVGIIYENMVFVMRDCTASPTDFQLPEVQNLSPTAILNTPTSIEVCAGDSLCFDVLASNPNTQRTVTITSSFPAGLNAGNPVFEMDTTVLNPRRATFCMATTGAMVGGPYVITFNATDNACVLPGFDSQQVSVTIYPSVSLSVTDTLLCAGSTLPVTASGGLAGATYTWTVLSGDATPGIVGNSGVQNLNTLNSDSQIEVTLNGVPAICNARDTLTVGVALSDVTLNITNESCIQNDGAIDAVITGGSGIYTYAWDNGAVTQDLAGITDGAYCLTVTETAIPGCSVQECGNVLTTLPPAGTISAVGATTICQGASATLQFVATGELGQPYAITVTGAGATVPASINHNGTFTVTPPVGTTTYTLTNLSYVNFPACSATANSQVTITVRPTVTGQFLASPPVCAGSTLNLQVDFSQAGTYDVTYTATPNDPATAPNPAPTPWTDLQVLTFNPAATTTYAISNVQYTTAPFCPSNTPSSVAVTVHPLPTATLTGGTSICNGACANLNLALTGTGPYTVNYTINGTPGVLTNITSPFVWNNCPTVTSTYVITSVTDANGCTATISGQSQTITVNPFPAFTFTGNTTICSGSSTNLILTPTSAGGPYDIVLGVIDTDPLTPATINLTSFAGGNYSVSPTVPTTYELQSVTYTGVPACAITPLTQVVITISQPPVVLNIAQNCNNISTAYTVSFTIAGTAPYTVNGTASPANFVSAAIPTGTGATFTIDDAGACPPLVYNSPAFNCPILTDAGTMALTPLSICGPNAATGVFNNNAVFDGNDEQTFVLHTGSGNTLGTIITQDCNDAVFGDADSPLTFSSTPLAGAIQYGVTYYISSVVGDDDGTGDCVNIGAANVDIAPGQPVTWFESPTANISGNFSICAGASISLPITFTGQAPFTFVYSINGANQPALTSFTNSFQITANTTGTYNLVSVSSATCPGTVSGSATVVVNSLPTVQLSANTTICAGSCANLTLTLTGTGPWQVNYTINGVAQTPLAVAASPFIWNVCPTATSTYCVTSVTDANICNSGAINVCTTVTVNPLPTSSITTGGSYCAGGSVSLPLVFTGTGPFNFTMNTPAGSPLLSTPGNTTFTATAPGNYFISNLSDANCSTTINSTPVLVIENPLPTLAILNNGVICSGQNFTFDYSFTGAAPFTYNLDAPVTDLNNQPSPNSNGTIVATDAGNYIISSVTDNNGCVSSAPSNTATLTVNPLPVVTLSGNATICANQSHGFGLVLTAGTGPFDYTITTPTGDVTTAGANTGDVYTANTAGGYFITSVTDANSCVNATNSATSTLTVHPLPTALWVNPDTAFCAGSSVNLTIALTGSAPWNLTYSLNGAPQTIAVPSAPFVLNATLAGTYCIDQVVDNNGCSTTPNDCVVVTQVNVPVANAGPNASTCSGVAIQVGTPGVVGVNYAWTNGFGIAFNNASLAQPSITPVNAGAAPVTNFCALTASLTASGITCAARDTVLVTVNPLPSITATVPDPTICFGETTTVTASGAGVGGSYAWTAAPTITGPLNQAAATVAPVGSVTYTVEGTDGNGCESTATVTVQAGTELLVTETFTNFQCFNVCEGNITLTPSGSYGTYAVTWTNPVPDATGFSQTNLCAGNYPYEVTDIQGCSSGNFTITITGLPENFIDDVIVTPTTCSDDLDGAIQIVEAAVDYMIYSEPGLAFIGPQPADTFTGLPAGNYDVYVTDINGCALDSLAIVITSQSLPITIAVDPITDIFCFQENMQFSGSAAGGFGNLVLNWYNCPDTLGCLIGQGTPFNFTILQDTTLYGVVTDELGCRSEIESVFAGVSDPIQLTITNGDALTICEGECVDLVAETQGGNTDLVVQWYEIPALIGDPTIGPDGLNQQVCPNTSTAFFAYANDGCNAPALDTIFFNVFETPEVIFEVDTTQGCWPLEVSFTNLTDPALVDDCIWDFGDGDTLNVCGAVTHTYTDTGNFFASLTITSPDGCVAVDTLDTSIEVYGYPELDFTWSPSTIDVLAPTVEFTNLTQGGVSYDWSFATFATSTETNPVFEFPAIDLATYTVCLQSETSEGCRDTLCRDLTVSSILQVWVPNSFTPNGDDVNDVWLPIMKGYDPDNYRLFIYNRWGTIVFQTTNPEEAWLGEVGNGAYFSQNDTFVYRLEVQRLSDNTFEVFEGNITLIR